MFQSFCTEIDYQNSELPIADPVLEEQCKRRGIRMAFLTVQIANQDGEDKTGIEAIKAAKELRGIMTEPIQDSSGCTSELSASLFLRMTFWSIQADQDVSLFSEQELAQIEAAANKRLGTNHTLTQERYETFKDMIIGEQTSQPTSSSFLVN